MLGVASGLRLYSRNLVTSDHRVPVKAESSVPRAFVILANSDTTECAKKNPWQKYDGGQKNGQKFKIFKVQ